MDKPATAAEVVPQQQSDVDTRERALEVDTSASLPAAGLARVGNSPAAIAIAPAAIADAAASDARLMKSLHQDDRTPERQSFAKMILVNMLAALTVSFAALSLGAAFGVLAERSALKGILSGGMHALITGTLGGTRVSTSGPTGPMSTVAQTLVFFSESDAFEERFPDAVPTKFVNMVILFAGCGLMLMGLVRVGKFINTVPGVVITGFMDGIAVLIWVDQVQILFGVGREGLAGPLHWNLIFTVGTTLLGFTLPLLLEKLLPPRVARIIPATLVVLVVMTLLGLLVPEIQRTELGEPLESFADFASIVERNFPFSGEGHVITWGLVWEAAPYVLQLCLLCYLDTLLTSLIVDKLIQERDESDEKTAQNKELAAQGLANSANAFVGGVPGAQATIYSVLLLKEGATMRLASSMVGVFVLIEMLLLQSVVSQIPAAVFSGILVKVGFDVFEWQQLRYYLVGIWHTFRDKKLCEDDVRTKYMAGVTLVEGSGREKKAREAAIAERARWARELGRRGKAAHITATGEVRLEVGYVSHAQFFFMTGTTLVTVLLNLNYAVIIFTALFHLLVFTGPERRQYHTLYLSDIVAGEPPPKKPDMESEPGATGPMDKEGLRKPLLVSAYQEIEAETEAERQRRFRGVMLGGDTEPGCCVALSMRLVDCLRPAGSKATRERRASVNVLPPKQDGPGGAPKEGTVIGSIFNLCNCMIGVGVLTLPTAFSQVGVVLGSGLLIGCATLVFGCYLIVAAALEFCPEATTYSGLISAGVGPRWARAYDVWLAATVFGTTLSWNVVIAGSLTDALVDLEVISLDENLLQWLSDRQLAVLATSVGVLWPLVVLPSFHWLRHISLVALTVMIYVTVAVALRGVQAAQVNQIPCDGCPPVELAVGSTEIFSALATFAFSFDVGPCHVPVLAELRHDKRRAVLIFGPVLAISTLMYLIIAAFGYLQFSSFVCPSVIESFTGDTLMTVGKFGVMVSSKKTPANHLRI